MSDVFEESAKQAAEICGAKVYTDANALINDNNVDAVFIVSPGFAHVDSLLEAIKAGKKNILRKTSLYNSRRLFKSSRSRSKIRKTSYSTRIYEKI